MFVSNFNKKQAPTIFIIVFVSVCVGALLFTMDVINEFDQLNWKRILNIKMLLS
jgi:hypothetical protein